MALKATLLCLLVGALCFQYSSAAPRKAVMCPVYACRCQVGYETIWITNNDGCQICSCQPIEESTTSSCLQVACRCPFGTVWTIENGCNVCSCNPNPDDAGK